MANPENWRVKDDVRRLTYNLMRCPAELMDLLGQMYEHTKPEIAGLILRMDSMFPSTVCFFLSRSYDTKSVILVFPVSYVHRKHGW